MLKNVDFANAPHYQSCTNLLKLSHLAPYVKISLSFQVNKNVLKAGLMNHLKLQKLNV